MSIGIGHVTPGYPCTSLFRSLFSGISDGKGGSMLGLHKTFGPICEDRVLDGPASGNKAPRVGISSTVSGEWQTLFGRWYDLGKLEPFSRWYGGIHLGPDRFKHINSVDPTTLDPRPRSQPNFGVPHHPAVLHTAAPCVVRTGSWTGPPRGKKAPRVGITSTVSGVRVTWPHLGLQSVLVST